MSRLLLQYDVRVQYRVNVPRRDDPDHVRRAIEEAVRQSGLTSGQTGVIPESIRFTWEEND